MTACNLPAIPTAWGHTRAWPSLVARRAVIVRAEVICVCLQSIIFQWWLATWPTATSEDAAVSSGATACMGDRISTELHDLSPL